MISCLSYFAHASLVKVFIGIGITIKEKASSAVRIILKFPSIVVFFRSTPLKIFFMEPFNYCNESIVLQEYYF